MTSASELFNNRRSRLGFDSSSSSSSSSSSNHINRRRLPSRPEEELETTTTHSLSTNTTPDRLPASVLLARERLFHRLRGGGGPFTTSRTTTSNINHHDHVFQDHFSFTTPYRAHANHPSPHHQTTPGLSPRALSCLLLQDFNFEDNLNAFHDCSICLETFKDEDKLVRLPCGHTFHYSCLLPWAKICGCCPYCRTDIVI